MSVNGLNMMKRQFLRVKQIADQTFQRGEKTELLNDELSAAEKRVDFIKQSCQNSGKKLSACIQRLATDGASSDRRSTKKVPEAILSECMEEWGLNLGEGSILGITMVDCARIQEALACDLLTYKTEVEESVVEPLQNILKVDVANIAKCRKQLAKVTAEMDAAKLRHQTALRNCQQVSTNSLASAVAKADSLREDSEDAATKVDQSRDMLAAEMFSLISREPELSRLFMKFCQLQLVYHRSALSVLESTLPELEAQINSYPYHPVFGQPLEQHLRYTNREIALVIETCVCWLLQKAISEEGLFRIGGSVTKIKKMKCAFDAGVAHLIEDEKDPHNVAGVLKLYLRSLPDPLLTFALYKDWIEAVRINDHGTQMQALWKVVNSLPNANFKNLRYLIKFLSKLCENSELNKMSSQNIAIVMGPNLLWSPVEESALGMNMTATNLHSSIVDILITYADWFFPGECEFHVKTPTSPRHLNGFPSLLRSSQLSLSATKLSNGDSAVDSLSSSPANSPKSPSPRVISHSKKKKNAPVAPDSHGSRNQITRSLSCSVFHGNLGEETLKDKRHTLSHQSISHEDLLSATKNKSVEVKFRPKSTPTNQHNGLSKPNESSDCKSGSTYSHSVPLIKPGRTKGKGLPPLIEHCQRNPIERPSVPPPERPSGRELPKENACELKAHSNSSSVVNNNKEEVPTSLDSKKFGETAISFMDDSDVEEEKSPLLCNEEQTVNKTNSKNEEQTITHGSGTPKWFDHYSSCRRLSDSVWFNLPLENEESVCKTNVDISKDGSDDVFEESKTCKTSVVKNISSFNEQYCTIIPVGNTHESTVTEDECKPLCKFSPPQDTIIKLRVNSDSQNTRL